MEEESILKKLIKNWNINNTIEVICFLGAIVVVVLIAIF